MSVIHINYRKNVFICHLFFKLTNSIFYFMIIDANINNTKKYYMRKKENILVQVVIQTIKKKFKDTQNYLR